MPHTGLPTGQYSYKDNGCD
jgi:hypothetical protein